MERACRIRQGGADRRRFIFQFPRRWHAGAEKRCNSRRLVEIRAYFVLSHEQLIGRSACVAWVTEAPALTEAAIMAASMISASASVAPALRALPVWISMQ